MKVEMEMEVEGEDSYEKYSMESSSSSYDVSSSPQRPSSLSELVSSCHSSDSSRSSPVSETNNRGSKAGQKNKPGRKAGSFAFRIKEHVRMGPKLSETVKGKLSVGAKIILKGGRENIFRHIFGVSEGEKLLKASQCYLSTTAGPIAGILFISTLKLAFFSERSITLPSDKGGCLKTPYKVLIPISKIKEANESENVNKPAQKYIEVVTEDGFEFWFMGFVRYEKAFMNLQKAISMSIYDKSA
ncbi:GEM-like protein 4 [Daucus carota subsp. sativus]|nr:PREDICTED: GEM-like protein 4 [Daucus carota subsp. sativus]